MRKHQRPGNVGETTRPRNRSDGKQDPVHQTRITDFAAVRAALEDVLDEDEIAGLSRREMVYLATIALEDLPAVPDDLIALITRHDQQQFKRAQELLTAPSDIDSGPRRLRSKGEGRRRTRTEEPLTQQSFLDDGPPLPAQFEAILGR